MNRPSSAVAMFDRYARGGRSLQVGTKGNYWAGRASLGAGRFADANAYFERAAAYPELFYGQLALERLGRSVAPPPAALPQYVTTQLQRTAFNSRRVVQAIRLLGQQGANEQALFVRALAESLDSDTDRNLAVELGQQIGRQDIAVWTARMARVKGSAFYVRQAYPTSGNVSGEPVVARPRHQPAGKLVRSLCNQPRRRARDDAADDWDGAGTGGQDGHRLRRLPADQRPGYNVVIGSSYFQRMLNIWDGNVPLAVASYNAGSGNVGKWVRQYGDPRGQVDVLKWIEAIPYVETAPMCSG